MFPDRVKIIKDGKPVKLESPDERDKDIGKAIELFKAYKNVSPEVQQAVDLMLKSAQPKP